MPIICATDFSPSSQAASDVGATLARKLGQPIVLFHSVQIPYSDTMDLSGMGGALTVALQEAASAQLESAAGTLRAAGLAVSTELSVGGPAAQLMQLAEAKQAEAIVLGTHGRAGVAKLFLGSVAELVMRESSVPVLVVHADAGAGPVQANQPLRLAVLLDGGSTDGSALTWAAHLADRTACETQVVRLVSPEMEAARFGIEELWDGLRPSGPLVEALNRSLTRQLAPFPRLIGAARRFVVGTEQVVAQTARDLAALDPTLVVLGVPSRKHRRMGRAVQPASLLRALSIPVVCVPEREADVPKAISGIDSVLVAVDLEQPAPAAVLQAYGLLRPGGGRVELCYVREHQWDAFGDVPLRPPLTPDERVACERALREMVPPEAEGLGIVTNVSVVEGATTAEAIGQAAARLGTDVVALATHDRHGLDRALHGSVTEAVLHSTRSPTLVVHT